MFHLLVDCELYLFVCVYICIAQALIIYRHTYTRPLSLYDNIAWLVLRKDCAERYIYL